MGDVPALLDRECPRAGVVHDHLDLAAADGVHHSARDVDALEEKSWAQGEPRVGARRCPSGRARGHPFETTGGYADARAGE
eukprot:108225-Pyramimonas_sp.AAC.1